MGIGEIVEWTKRKLSELAGDDVPVTSAGTVDALTTGTAAIPSLDLYESEREYRVMVDAPGATAPNTHLTWNEVDTLVVHIRRTPSDAAAPLIAEFRESDWYREVILPADAHVSKANAEVRQGVLTIRVPKRLTPSGKLIPVYAA
ncbi:MAG TPA: Hsp20/alpha crystallin family protein [Polyangiaceae bacterium]|nr:Hsp20/alpha crystallin family protein [Polyangiaceae bacterium]